MVVPFLKGHWSKVFINPMSLVPLKRDSAWDNSLSLLPDDGPEDVGHATAAEQELVGVPAAVGVGVDGRRRGLPRRGRPRAVHGVTAEAATDLDRVVSKHAKGWYYFLEWW